MNSVQDRLNNFKFDLNKKYYSLSGPPERYGNTIREDRYIFFNSFMENIQPILKDAVLVSSDYFKISADSAKKYFYANNKKLIDSYLKGLTNEGYLYLTLGTPITPSYKKHSLIYLQKNINYDANKFSRGWDEWYFVKNNLIYAACCIHENIYFIHEDIKMSFIKLLRSEEGFTLSFQNVFNVIKVNTSTI